MGISSSISYIDIGMCLYFDKYGDGGERGPGARLVLLLLLLGCVVAVGARERPLLSFF
jgi:hypothetical protein